jgi:hypothetical protein
MKVFLFVMWPYQLTMWLTFIMSTIVFKAMSVITKYSNLGDTTNFQILYLTELLFCGM